MTDEPTDQSVSKSKLPLYLSLGIVGGLVLAYFFIPTVQEFFNEAWNVLTSDDQERIRAWVASFGWFGSLLLILAMSFQMFLLIVPTVLFMVV